MITKNSIKSCINNSLFGSNKNNYTYYNLNKIGTFFPFSKYTRRNFLTNNKTFNDVVNNNSVINKMLSSNKFTLSSNLQKKNFSVKTSTIQKYSIELLLPNFDKFSMDFEENATFKDVANSIQKNFKFENIEFRTWDHSIIALGNDLNSTLLSRKFVFLKIDSFEWQLINYSNLKKNFNEAFDDCKKNFYLRIRN
jgi:hypothetical protein